MKELLQKLKELDLPKGKFAIFGSGPICIRKLRKAGDLDVIVTEDIYSYFRNKLGFKAEKKASGFEYLDKNGVELYKNWAPGDWDVKKLIKEAEIIDGFPFVRLEEVLKWKRLKKREKDIKDIKLIEDYLNK